MTLSELLALVGRSWTRLLIYPGGLTLLICATIVFQKHWVSALSARSAVGSKHLISLAAPWLAVALLPLPGAVNLGRSIDAMVVIALLDVPLLVSLRDQFQHAEASQRTHGALRLATLLNGYPTLVLALLLLALGGGSLELAQLARLPEPLDRALLHWTGAVALTLSLPAVLGAGAFVVPRHDQSTTLGLQFRACGYVALAALPSLAQLEGQVWQLVPVPLTALMLWGFHRATSGHPARPWAWAYLALDGLLLGALLGGAVFTLVERVQ